MPPMIATPPAAAAILRRIAFTCQMLAGA